jgi:hypothetical protein
MCRGLVSWRPPCVVTKMARSDNVLHSFGCNGATYFIGGVVPSSTQLDMVKGRHACTIGEGWTVLARGRGGAQNVSSQSIAPPLPVPTTLTPLGVDSPVEDIVMIILGSHVGLLVVHLGGFHSD